MECHNINFSLVGGKAKNVLFCLHRVRAGISELNFKDF